jgi:hypothetical protein
MKVPGFSQKQTYGVNQEKQAPNYLNGQIWNRPNDEPKISIGLAPNYQTNLVRGKGSGVIRISLDRPRNRDTSFKIKLSGTAELLVDYLASSENGGYIFDADYYDRKHTITAGELFLDVNIAPALIVSEAPKTVIVALESLDNIRVGTSEITLTISPARFGYRIYRRVNNLELSLVTTLDAIELTPTNVTAYDAVWLATCQQDVAGSTNFIDRFYIYSSGLIGIDPSYPPNSIGAGRPDNYYSAAIFDLPDQPSILIYREGFYD